MVSFPQSSFNLVAVQSRNNILALKMCCSSLVKSENNNGVKKINGLDFNAANNDKLSWRRHLFPIICVQVTLWFLPLPYQYFKPKESKLNFGNCTLGNHADFVQHAFIDILVTTSLTTVFPIFILLLADSIEKSSIFIREGTCLCLGYFMGFAAFFGDYDLPITLGRLVFALVLALFILGSFFMLKLHVKRMKNVDCKTALGFWISVDFLHNLTCGLAACANTLEYGAGCELLMMLICTLYQKISLGTLFSHKFYECGCSKKKVLLILGKFSEITKF